MADSSHALTVAPNLIARKPPRSLCPMAPWPSRFVQRWHVGALLAQNKSITSLMPALRDALHAVSHAERPSLALPAQVFELLVADVLGPVRAADSEPCGELSEAYVQWLGRFWFACASGEVRPA